MNREMAMETSYDKRSAEELVYLFGSFLPSQRAILLEQSKVDQAQFMSALQSFLSKWARAEWLEEYNVERVGEWIAKQCGSVIRSEAEVVAKNMLSDGPTGIQRRTYQSLLDGMHRAKQSA